LKNLFYSLTDENIESINPEFFLPWFIDLNPIEQSYIDWLVQIKKSKFLITWPWMNVKFIPILISEYLKTKSSTIVIISDRISDSLNKNSIRTNLDFVYNRLHIIDPYIEHKLREEDKKFLKKIDRKFFFRKIKYIPYSYKIIGQGEVVKDNCFEYDSQRKCLNWLLKDIELYYGENAVRKIDIRKKDGNSILFEKSEEGYIDITIYQENELWSGTVKYKTDWIFQFLKNYKNKFNVSSIFPFIVFNNSNNKQLEIKKKVYFLSSNLTVDDLEKSLKEFEPDLLIIENTDYFVKDIIYNGDRSKFLTNLINKFDKILLLFSTSREFRHLYANIYQINDKIIYHTWDAKKILNLIKKDWFESKYPNPVSSLLSEVPDEGKIPELNFIKLNELDIIDKISALIENSDLEIDAKKICIKYFYYLSRSPLYVKGDYRKSEFFKRKVGINELQYDYIISILRTRLPEDKLNIIIDGLNETYKIKLNSQTNPIFEAIKETLTADLKITSNIITLIVDSYDVKGTRILLKQFNLSELEYSRIKVCSWGKLSQIEESIENGQKHIVITANWPSLNYSIYFSNKSKFFFIGSEKNLIKIRNIIEDRVLDYKCRPISEIKNNNEFLYPNLLLSSISEIDFDLQKDIATLYDELIEINIDYQTSIDSINEYSDFSNLIFEPSQQAFLVIDSNDFGLFIPENTSLLILDGIQLNEISLDVNIKKLEELIKNKRILLDKHGTYLSFRNIFTKFMLEYDKEIAITKGPFSWDNFRKVFIESIQWILIIIRAINMYSEKKSVDVYIAHNEIAKYLSNLDLNAKDENYIKGWWSNYQEVSTQYGTFPLFNVEHPKSRSDIINIYTGLNQLLPELKLSINEGLRSYVASIFIQNFRRAILKGKISQINPKLRYLFEPLKQQIFSIIESSDTFLVKSIHHVTINKQVSPYKRIKDYQTFIT